MIIPNRLWKQFFLVNLLAVAGVIECTLLKKVILDGISNYYNNQQQPPYTITYANGNSNGYSNVNTYVVDGNGQPQYQNGGSKPNDFEYYYEWTIDKNGNKVIRGNVPPGHSNNPNGFRSNKPHNNNNNYYVDSNQSNPGTHVVYPSDVNNNNNANNNNNHVVMTQPIVQPTPAPSRPKPIRPKPKPVSVVAAEEAPVEMVEPEPERPAPVSAKSSALERASKICGLSYNTRIVGGKDADPNTWIWMVALIRKNGSNYCGGALISDYHIVTAAHCLKNQSPKDMYVRLGAYDFSEDAAATSEDHEIENFKIHPQYDRYTHRNDIAILTMVKKAQFTHFIRPICLPQKRRSFLNEMATVVGWGSIDYGAPSSTKLREVTLPIWSNSDCTESYKQNITETNLCAGYKDGGRDSCQGDSGGPLMLQGANNKWMLIGVVSWGIKCGEPNYPGVYTRVNRYLDWIESNTR